MQDSWTPTTLGDHVELITGKAFKSKQFLLEPPGVRLARGDNITEGLLRWGGKTRYWPELTPDLERLLLRDGDVLIGMDGSKVGKNWTVVREDDLPLLLVQRVARLRALESLDVRLLASLIRSQRFRNHVDSVKTGSSIPHISPGQIREFEFLLPPPGEQRRIAAVLGALDDKIELNRKMNQTLEEIAQTIFKSWFIDFDGHDLAYLVDSELGLIPQGWQIEPLSHVIKYAIGGQWGKGSADEKHTNEVHCIRGTDIPAMSVGAQGAAPQRFLKPSALEKRRLQEGDLVFEVSGGSPTQSTGRVLLLTVPRLTHYPSEMVSSNFCRTIRPKSWSGGVFLYFLLDHMYRRGDFFALENGTTGIKNLPFTNFSKTFPLLSPSADALELFGTTVGPILARIDASGAESRTLAGLRDTLLPKLLSGEIRVPEAEEQVEAAL